MENQHRKIAGYRDMDQAEIDAINAIKRKGAEIGQQLDALLELPNIDKRALAIAKTELQTGIMWAVRAIAQPQGF